MQVFVNGNEVPPGVTNPLTSNLDAGGFHITSLPAAAGPTEPITGGSLSTPVNTLLAATTVPNIRAAWGTDAPAGPFSATAYLNDTDSSVQPLLAVGNSIAFAFWKVANVASEQVIAWKRDSYGAPTTGWYFGIQPTGEFFLTLQGIGKIALGAFNGLSNDTLHAIAISFHSTGVGTQTLHYSIAGGAVVTVAANGVYVPPNATDPFYIGYGTAGFERPPVACDIYEILTTSTEVSDADLVLLSTPATPLATVATGTLAFDFYAPSDLFAGVFYKALTTRGSTRLSLAINGGLTRRVH